MEKIKVHDRYFAPYLTESEIQAKVQQLATLLNAEYQNKEVLILSVLNGAFMFTADLVRELAFSPEIHFVKISTYGNQMQSSHAVKEFWGFEGIDFANRHILLVEDIIDTGYTAEVLRDLLQSHQPQSLAFVSLFFKPATFQGKTPPEYIGFSIPPDFIVGYGLDYAQKGRELRNVYIAEETK